MANIISKVITVLKEFFSKMTKREKIRLVILAVVIITLSIVISVVLNRTTYATLYSGLTPSEAGEILTVLEGMEIPTQVQGTGTILVPEERVTDLRMRLSAQGYNNDKFDYSEYFTNIGFGTTDSDRQVLNKMYIEAQIQSYINNFDGILKSFVVVNLPKTSSFIIPREDQEASALVQLVLDGTKRLTTEEANAIGEAVMVSVPGLKLENIRIVDSTMYQYKLGENADDFSITGINQQLILESEVKATLEKTILDLLSPIFGTNVKTAVFVTLNFDKETVQAIEFAPPVEDMTEGLAVSASRLYEDIRGIAEDGGVVGTDVNGLGTVTYPWGDLGADEYYRKLLEEINYELNQTVTNIEKAPGGIKSLTCSVLLDSESVPEDYSAQVANLVSTAIGVNTNNVTVERLPFQNMDDTINAALERQQEMLNQLRTQEIIKAVIQGAVILALVLAVLLFARSIFRTIFKKEEPLPAGGIDYVADEDLFYDGDELVGEQEEEDEFDFDSKSEILAQIERFIEKNPQAIVQLLRNWISED